MLVGKDLGPYRVDKELGSGAMGAVYRAKHKDTGERVAVKLMSPALGASESAQARFVREVQILKQLSHPNIVRYKGSGRYHGSPFFIMEYVEGESLDRFIASYGRLTWEKVVELGVQLCAALQHSHDKGIIHRDLKPSNVMVLPDGTVKLTDFGIAKDTDVTALTAANSTVGTAAYMSPEQCRGARDISHKSDLYSLGVMFYELLTGRKPFQAETAMEMFLKHANEPFPPPAKLVFEIPPWLNTLVCQLMEKKPEQRPLNADMVAESLRRVREKVEAQQSAGVDRAKKRRVDRDPTDAALDETDRDAARVLLGKKKKKKKGEAFYQQAWFTVAAVALVAVALIGVFYVAFLKAPSAESLYTAAEEARKAPDLLTRVKARGEYMQPFLDYYPTHEKAATVRRWIDEVDLENTEEPLYNRRDNFKAQGEQEPIAREALDNEDLGKLAEAGKLWNDLLPLKKDADPEKRGWGLVAEKHLREFADAEKLLGELRTELQSEKIVGPKEARQLREERFARQKLDTSERNAFDAALEALRAEQAGQAATARARWDELKTTTRGNRDRRLWYLLAAKKARELVDVK